MITKLLEKETTEFIPP